MALGGNPARFWKITPAEVAREMQGLQGRLRREHNETAWLAWHIEALSRTKKLPKIQDMMTGAQPRKPLPPQTPDILLANMKLAFGQSGSDPA